MIVLIVLILGMSALTYAQSISYDQLIDTASKNSYRLKLGLTDTKIEQSRLDTLYSGYYPTLTAGYNVEYNKKLDGSSGGSASIGDTVIYSGDTYEDSLSLRMNYELYHFGTTDQQIQMQRREIQIKTLARCIEENKLHNEILDTYTDALKAQIESNAKDSIRNLRKELYTDKERLFQAGKESRVSVADEAIEIINLERDIERAKMRYDESMLALGKLSTLSVNPQEDILLSLNSPLENNIIPKFDESIEAQSYREKLFQKDHEISMNLRSQFPVVSAYGNYYAYGSDNGSFGNSMSDISPNSWNAGLSVRWDIFNGFKYNSEAQRLKLEKQRLSEEYELRKSEYESEIQTITNKTQHLERLETHENVIVSQTHEKISRIHRLRASGESDAITQLTAQIELLERELNLKIEQTQIAYEQQLLLLRNKGIIQCTQP